MPLPLRTQIELHKLGQSFLANDQTIELFNDFNFSFEQGRSYAITGPSGSGKSSLLMLASGLEKPSGGSVYCYMHNDNDKRLERSPIDQLRSEIGFIFQQFHLLPELDALNNVALPLKLRGSKHAIPQAKKWLERVGLSHRLNHKPSQLSGGEQQRVAIARSLVFEPKFIFADEPTGNLDTNSANEVADMLFECCKSGGAGLILVTHSSSIAERAEQRLSFSEGRITHA
jgi:putative ABC transport system ATP-binding protein